METNRTVMAYLRARIRRIMSFLTAFSLTTILLCHVYINYPHEHPTAEIPSHLESVVADVRKLSHDTNVSYLRAEQQIFRNLRTKISWVKKKLLVGKRRDPFPFNYTIDHPDTCKGELVDAVLYVHTSVDHVEFRKTIRGTWGNVDFYKRAMNKNIKLLFFVGIKPNNSTLQTAIEMEALLYGDIIQSDFVDSYHNLTYKALSALRWITRNCPQAKFVVKADDDVMLVMPHVFSLMRHYDMQMRGARPLLGCFYWWPKSVNRKGKWFVSKEEYPPAVYPGYCQGALYVMDMTVAKALHQAAHYVDFLWVDDALVTGVLRHKLALPITKWPKAVRTSDIMRSQKTRDFFYTRLKNNTVPSYDIIGYQKAFFYQMWDVMKEQLQGSRWIRQPEILSDEYVKNTHKKAVARTKSRRKNKVLKEKCAKQIHYNNITLVVKDLKLPPSVSGDCSKIYHLFLRKIVLVKENEKKCSELENAWTTSSSLVNIEQPSVVTMYDPFSKLSKSIHVHCQLFQLKNSELHSSELGRNASKSAAGENPADLFSMDNNDDPRADDDQDDESNVNAMLKDEKSFNRADKNGAE